MANNTNDLIRKLSEAIRNCMSPVREVQKNSELDEKLVLSKVLESLIEAQGLIADIQAGYQDALNEKEQLVKQAKELQQWEKDALNYEPFRLASGCTVVVPKSVDTSPYLREWYCKHCFDNKKKSQLQPKLQSIVQFCPACKTEIWESSADQQEHNEAAHRASLAHGAS